MARGHNVQVARSDKNKTIGVYTLFKVCMKQVQ
uniref:Uncharacterized protein n=1 Tax=Anguilla anguilla TaxID=7936 RepID=A0A0E9QBB9_ANGAN